MGKDATEEKEEKSDCKLGIAEIIGEKSTYI